MPVTNQSLLKEAILKYQHCFTEYSPRNENTWLRFYNTPEEYLDLVIPDEELRGMPEKLIQKVQDLLDMETTAEFRS